MCHYRALDLDPVVAECSIIEAVEAHTQKQKQNIVGYGIFLVVMGGFMVGLHYLDSVDEVGVSFP